MGVATGSIGDSIDRAHRCHVCSGIEPDISSSEPSPQDLIAVDRPEAVSGLPQRESLRPQHSADEELARVAAEGLPMAPLFPHGTPDLYRG